MASTVNERVGLLLAYRIVRHHLDLRIEVRTARASQNHVHAHRSAGVGSGRVSSRSRGSSTRRTM
jgi:hypothetical protein